MTMTWYLYNSNGKTYEIIARYWSRNGASHYLLARERCARAVHDYMPAVTILQAKRALITKSPIELAKNPYAMHDIIRIAIKEG